MSNQDILLEQQKIYPKLPADGENFRLNKVNMVLYQLGEEHKHYEHVRKKYVRVRSFLHGSAVTTGTLSGILTASGIGTSLTGPGIIIGVPLSAVGGVLGLTSACCGIAVKRLTRKISKHERTIQLIISKENSINDLVSKALHNNHIDEKEFELIMSELTKYEKLKSSIRRKENEHILKNEPVDIEKLKEELRKELVNQLVNQKK